jgi:protein NirF
MNGVYVSRRSCRSLLVYMSALQARMVRWFLASLVLVTLSQFARADDCLTRGSGDLGIVIERASGSVQIIDTTAMTALTRVTGLGDVSHASAVFSRDARFAYVFGRDGGLSKIDLLCGTLVKRVVQAGNSIGGAISQDGSLVAVSNYTPGGVKVFAADSLELVADLPAQDKAGNSSKVVGLVDAPGQQFVYTLYDAGELRIADLSNPAAPLVTTYPGIGRLPYDALITPDGRYYIAGLFGEDGLALIDLWHTGEGVQRILDDYGRGEEKLPVYKMPHLEGWAIAGRHAFIPAVGRHEVLVVDRHSWKQVARIPVHGQPVFVVARPDGRQVWVNFAHPLNDTVQVIDTEQMKVVHAMQPGKGVLHMEFAPRGEHVWLSVRDLDQVQVYDTQSFQRIARLEVEKPSGIFFTARAHRTGL